jgi:hypothetical protein
MRRFVAGLAAGSILLLVMAGPARGEQMALDEVLVFSHPELNTTADVRTFEQHALQTIASARETLRPGNDLHLLAVDRGSRKGQYAFIATGTLRNPPTNASPSGAALSPYARGEPRQIEYHLIGADTMSALPAAEVLGVHYTKVRTDQAAAFEDFVRDRVHPAVATLRPDLRILYYKAVHGADAGSYLTIFALTKASRDKYWPGGSDSDDLRAAFAPLRALASSLSKYLVEGSFLSDPKFAAAVFESREWSDFVVIPASGR